MEPDIARFIQDLNQRPIPNNYPEFELNDDHQIVWKSTTRTIPQSQIDPVLINIDLSEGIFFPDEENNEDEYDNEEEEEEEDDDDEKGEEEDEEEEEEEDDFDIDNDYEYGYDYNCGYEEQYDDDNLQNYHYGTFNTIITKTTNSGNYQNELKLDRAIRVSNNITILQFPNMDDKYVYYNKISDSRYEPKVVRELIITSQLNNSKSKSKTKSKNKKRQLHGLCPYCQVEKFYEINSSAYLHHLTINHGIFSNGNVIKDPIINSNSDEFAKCPYEGCNDNMIKLKRQEPHNRFKAYCRHVKLHHYEGKNS